MSEWSIELSVTIGVAVCAALLAYVFSVVVTRKGLLHDAKIEAYKRISGLCGETIDLLRMRLDAEDVESSSNDTDSALYSIMELSRTLIYAGDFESVATLMDEKGLSEEISKKGERELIRELKLKANRILSEKMMEDIRELSFRTSELKLVRPSDDVTESLEKIIDLFILGNAITYKKLSEMLPDVSPMIKKAGGMGPDMLAMIPERKAWDDDVLTAYNGLVEAMCKDLKRTTGWI